jgi:hypothetical protein
MALVSHRPFPEKGHDPSQKSWLRPASAWSRAFEPELLVEPVVEAPAQRLFGEPIGGRRPRSEMDGAGLDRGDEVGVGSRLPDHPPRRGLLGGDRLCKFRRPPIPNPVGTEYRDHHASGRYRFNRLLGGEESPRDEASVSSFNQNSAYRFS